MENVIETNSEPVDTENSDNGIDGLDIGASSKHIDKVLRKQPAVDKQNVKPEVKPEQPQDNQITKHKVKVNGQETEVELQELIRGYSHSQAANQKFKEAAEIRDSFIKELSEIKTNPNKLIDFAEKLGVDFEKLAHDRILEKIKYESMSEVERELYDARKKLNQYETAEQEKARLEKESEAQREVSEAQERLDREMLELFPEEGRVLNSREKMDLLNALSLMQAKHQAKQPMTLKQAYEFTTKQYSNMVDLDNLDVSKLQDKHWDIINKELIKRNSKLKPQEPVSRPVNNQTKKVTDEDYFNNLNKKYGLKNLGI